MTPNERFAKAAGICNHDEYDSPYHSARCLKCGVKRSDPTKHHIDFTDAREVLSVMMWREDWIDFADTHFLIATIDIDGTTTYAIPVNLIPDRTGKLRDLATEWMEAHNGTGKA